MKAYRLSVVVIDFDQLGEGELLRELAAARFGNDCISIAEGNVRVEQALDLGEWRDDHPLNQRTTDIHAWMAAHDPKHALKLTAEAPGQVIEVGHNEDDRPMVAIRIYGHTLGFPATIEQCRAWAAILADDCSMTLSVTVVESGDA